MILQEKFLVIGNKHDGSSVCYPVIVNYEEGVDDPYQIAHEMAEVAGMDYTSDRCDRIGVLAISEKEGMLIGATDPFSLIHWDTVTQCHAAGIKVIP